MALNHKIIEIRKYAGSWEAVIEITDTDSKVVYCEMPKIDGNKPTEKAFIRGVLKKYESGAYALSDTMVKINGSPIGIPIWSYGLRPSADPARVLKYWG